MKAIIIVRYVLELTKNAYDLFVRSEVEEKRQLIKLLLSNMRGRRRKPALGDV